MPELTKEIVRLASEANKAANRARDAVDDMVHGLPHTINQLEDRTRALIRAVDKLTTAIADEEA